MTASQVLALLNSANNMMAALSVLVPEIEANYAQVRDAMSDTDEAKLHHQIVSLHEDTLALTQKLDALRS